MRRALGAAALATATAGALFLPAAPASAAPPVDGYVDAFVYSKSDVGCDVSPTSTPPSHRVFTPATGKRTAHAASDFAAAPTGGGPVTARGRAENDTSGKAEASAGAFDVVRFTADQLVRLRNTRASDCHLGLNADSQSGATLHVEHRGRVHLEWDRGSAGQIEQIYVSRNGNVKVNKIRPHAHGDLTFRVRPGDYTVFVQFVTRANERDIAVGHTLTKRAHFSVVLDYHH
jgi:hypothetical protein